MTTSRDGSWVRPSPSLVASLALCFVNFSFRGVGFLFTPGLKVLVSVIVAVIMIIVGVGHWIDRWNLLLSGEGVVFGATYADINARKPGLCVLTGNCVRRQRAHSDQRVYASCPASRRRFLALGGHGHSAGDRLAERDSAA